MGINHQCTGMPCGKWCDGPHSDTWQIGKTKDTTNGVKFGGMGMQETFTQTGATTLKSDLEMVVKLVYVCYILTWVQHGAHMRVLTAVHFCGRHLEFGDSEG